MANCVTIPTLTTTTVVQSNRLSTTVTNVVSTGPPTLSTVTFRTCTPVATNATCVPTAASSVQTIAGIATTVQAPVTITVQVPITQIATLFGSSCTTSPGQVVTTPSSSSPITTPTTSTTSTTSQSISIFTPAPVVITSQSYSTMSDGSVSTATLTSTSILPVSTIYSSPTATQSHSTNIAPIVGGAVGGFFVVAALVLVSWYFIKRRGRFNDIFEKDDYTNTSASTKNATGPNPAPHTYHYTPVSHGLANSAMSPPTSPPQGQVPLRGGNEMGIPGHAGVPGHYRSPSLTPLMAAGLGAGVAAQTGQLAMNASNANSTASRPSSSGSAQPLVPQTHQGFAPGQGQGQGYGQGGQGQAYMPGQSQGYAPQNLPPGNPGYTTGHGGFGGGQAQGYAPGHQGFGPGQGHATGQGQGYAPGQGQGFTPGQGQGYAPSAGLSHNVSTGSASSGGTSWAGSSGSGGGAYNAPPLPNIIPVLGGAAGTAATRHRPQGSESSGYDRSGSPVSIQEQRVLQVMNAGPEASSSSAAAYPSTADATTAYDGKGRPINLGGERPALVHLDGGRYEETQQQQPPAVPRPAGAAPPAYTN